MDNTAEYTLLVTFSRPNIAIKETKLKSVQVIYQSNIQIYNYIIESDFQ